MNSNATSALSKANNVMNRWFVVLCFVALVQVLVAWNYSATGLQRAAFAEVGLLLTYSLVNMWR